MPKQRKTFKWSEFVSLGSRFRRSVHLQRDAQDGACLDGYVVTPLVRTALRRIMDGLRPGATSRAWSITGPYGSGKSAFGVFLANLLGVPSQALTIRARDILARVDRRLHEAALGPESGLGKAFVLAPVLITGERKPLDLLVLEGVHKTAAAFWNKRGARPLVVSRLASAARRAASARAIPARDVVALLEETCAKIAASTQPGSGLLIVLDEAGKALEFAVQSPERGDIQLLQELAEFANRSGEVPLVFAVILHQAFEQYAGRVNAARRNEWAKVQGRFEDVAFLEATDQVLHLVGAALTRSRVPKDLSKRVDEVAQEAAEACAAAGTRDAASLRSLFTRAAPLNPITALALAPLFRSRLAQNERSLFAFLASNEPCGFQEFLRQPIAAGDSSEWLYSVDHLYDYVCVAFGGRLYGPGAREWARIGEALRRLPLDADEWDSRVVKAIGLLGFLGEPGGLGASERLLATALCDGSSNSRDRLRQTLDRLKRSSVIVYRKYRDAFQLWEGSDLDVEALVQTALQQMDARSGLAERLTRTAKPRPLIARRHLLETGTLRHFEVQYVQDGDVAAPSLSYAGPADGAVWLALPADPQGRELLRRELESPMGRLAEGQSGKPVIVVVPEDVDKLQELAGDAAALAWVQAHAQGLQDDPVARREVAGRLAEAEGQLRRELAAILGAEKPATWHFRGGRERLAGPKGIARFLSTVLDSVYNRAPHVHNELLNRRHLSSSAAAARRLLMEAMLHRRDQPRLGIEGFPAEYSMYASLLEAHGLHRDVGGVWRLTAPVERKRGGLLPVYEAARRMLQKKEDGRFPVAELYNALRMPPYGVHDGLLPVLLLALLLELEAEVSVYEEGAFLPAVTGPVIERLLRVPEKFELQRVSLDGGRRIVFAKLLQLFNQTPGEGARGLLPLVRQLVRFVTSLPEYARKTRTVSSTAQDVRDALLRAREPVSLVFESLPRACGFEPIAPDSPISEDDARSLASRLHAALLELQRAYKPTLLNLIETGLREEFRLAGQLKLARQEFGARARVLTGLAADSELKALLIRLGDAKLDDDAWLGSVATLVGGVPPEVWQDHTLERYRLNLGVFGRRYRALESFALDRFGQLPDNAQRLVRIAVAEPGELERERVVAVKDDERGAIESLTVRVAGLVKDADASPDAALVALALAAREILDRLESTQDTARRQRG